MLSSSGTPIDNYGPILMIMRASVLGSWLEPSVLRVIAKRTAEHGGSAVGSSKLRVFHIRSSCEPRVHKEHVQAFMNVLHRRYSSQRGTKSCLRRYVRLRLASSGNRGLRLGPRGRCRSGTRGARPSFTRGQGDEAQANCGVQRPHLVSLSAM